MTKEQGKLAGYIERELGARFKDWEIEVAENVLGCRWAVIFIEKTDDWMHNVGWFPFEKLSCKEDASFIINEVISKMV